MKYTQFTEDVFVIDCWPNTKEKENTLIELINRVKIFGAPIILCGHYPVSPEIQSMVDYYLFDSKNDLLYEKDYARYGINSDRWSNGGHYKLTNKVEFHHDYAIWETMRNAFEFANVLGKKYIHFLEYDNLPDEFQYKQAFMEYVRNHDAVVYEYNEGSTKENNPYSSTYIFSIRTQIALDMIDQINTKDEYFKNKPDRWQLEKVFYQTLQKVTGNIFVSKYISNNNELNMYAAWNRNGILMNGAKFQTYFGVDDVNRLHIHFISGFNNQPADKDYLVEVRYNNKNRFYNVLKGQYHLFELGGYKQGSEVIVLYQGVEVHREILKDNIKEYKRKNDLKLDKTGERERKLNYNFVDGAFIEILEDGDYTYNVEFIDKKSGNALFSIDLKSNHWAKSGIKYYVDWLIRIKGIDTDFFYEYEFEPKDKKVFICFETKSLGDTLAFMPYVDEFRKEHNCKVVCSTFNNNLFRKQYPDVEFVEPGSVVNDVYSLYRLGLFYKDGKIDYERHPTDPKPEPLLKIASDILGLDYKEVRPKLGKFGMKKRKLVSIAIHSTAQAKYWNNPDGWQDVVDYLIKEGYEVRLLSKEEEGYMGNFRPKGVTIQPPGSLYEVMKTLEESEFFMGISSGLSWLAWSMNIPTVIISGFTDIETEPIDNVVRIINKDVCNSCWNKYNFDAGDWNWCPVMKGTEFQFECTKKITSKHVIEKINHLVK